jgi:hypothetical protein
VPLSPFPGGVLQTRLLSIDEARSRDAPDFLTAAALLYLTLPNLIFIVGWLRPAAAVPLLALTLVALWQFLRRQDVCWRIPQTQGAAALIVVFAFAWASLGGAGHFFQTNPDWITRDKVLGDLTFSAWPPAYSFTDGHAHILRSAFGFFFPAAVVGKLFGIGSVDIAAYLYVALGCSLFLLLLPLPRKAGAGLVFLLLLVAFFSGMDFLGIVLVTGTTPLFPLRLEWWVPFSYSSLTGQMHWGPNHALPLWLVTVLFYRHWGHSAWPALFALLLPLTVLWTPFAAPAILPFLVLATWRWFAEGRGFSDSRITLAQIACATLLAWLMLRLMTLDISAIPGAPTAEVAPNPDRFALKYLLFILMEFGILALLLAKGLRHSHGLFWLACAILVVLPLYQYGPSNDTMLRLSTPCLVILLIATLDQVQAWVRERHLPRNAWLILPTLMVGACTPFNEMWRAAVYNRTLANYGISLIEQHGGAEASHYVGRLDRPDLVAVLRPPTLVPRAAERKAQGLWPPAKPR